MLSIMTGEIVFKISPSNFSRYELFGIFLYFSIVWTIYGSASSEGVEAENISLGSLKLMGFSIHPMLVIIALTVLVLTFVFITA